MNLVFNKQMEANFKIKMDNAAFENQPAVELARILRKVAEDVEWHSIAHVGDAVFALDINGNSVGKLTIDNSTLKHPDPIAGDDNWLASGQPKSILERN